MNRKTIIAALMMALSCAWTVCEAQQTHTVAFGYDLDGNRISREILFIRMERNGEAKGEFLSSVTDSLETIEVSLYPNPTNDRFFVKIKGETGKNVEAALAHVSGAVLEKRVLSSSLESFDLSGVASGVYLLKLTVDKKTYVWKVIKKQ